MPTWDKTIELKLLIFPHVVFKFSVFFLLMKKMRKFQEKWFYFKLEEIYDKLFLGNLIAASPNIEKFEWKRIGRGFSLQVSLVSCDTVIFKKLKGQICNKNTK